MAVPLVRAARDMGLDRGTLENWRAEGCPGIPPAPFDAAAILAWAAANGKRAAGGSDLKAEKTIEEIRKLKIRNDREEGRLVERAWVAERIQRAAGELNAFRAKSELEHPTRFAAAAGDIAHCRTVVRGIWDEVFANIQGLHKHFAE